MTNPNVLIAADKLPDPMLSALVTKLLLDRPNWFFREPKNVSNFSQTLEGQVRVPEGKHYIRVLDVYQDSRLAGQVSVAREYRHRADDRFNYEIHSDRIDNGRRRNIMKTTKIDIAARNAKKYFQPSNTAELLYDIVCHVDDRFTSALSNLKYYISVSSAFNSGRSQIAQMYLHSLFMGTPPNPEHETILRETILSQKFEEGLSKYLLASAMQNHKYKVISIIDGDYCMYANDEKYPDKVEASKAEVLALPFEGLPTKFQDKLAVLQLMEDNEVVLDVGYRLNSDAFAVVDN